MATTGWSSLSNLGKFGVISQGFGVVGSVIGAYSAAQTEKYKTKSLALSLQHKKDMALFNQRMKESQAQHIGRAYNKKIMMLGLKQGAAKSAGVVSIASRGGVRGYGSNRDVMVSNDILAQIDKNTMNSNKVRAVENKRLEGVGLGIQGSMYGMSASNMFSSASQINPFMNMTSSLLTGTSSLISSLPESMLRA